MAKVALDSTAFLAQPAAGHTPLRRSFLSRLIAGFAGLVAEGLLLLAFMIAIMSLLLSELHRSSLLTSGFGALVGGYLLLAISSHLERRPFDCARLLGSLPIALALLLAPAIKALLWA